MLYSNKKIPAITSIIFIIWVNVVVQCTLRLWSLLARGFRSVQSKSSSTLYTVCPRSNDPIYIVTYYINNSLLHGNTVSLIDFIIGFQDSHKLKVEIEIPRYSWPIYVIQNLWIQTKISRGPWIKICSKIIAEIYFIFVFPFLRG